MSSHSAPLTFDNRFRRELPADLILGSHTREVQNACWSEVAPTPVSAPHLLAYSREMAATLGLDHAAMQSSEVINALSGNGLLPGMQPYATCYGGHQFGNWAGQLGDGRAILLGEVVTPGGERWELQLKGAGPTPYSRRADGRAVLRSSIREFLCSEAMFHLGVPTTRALSLIASGDAVRRDMFYDGHPRDEPGAIVARVAPSFTRFGHFEILAARNDRALLNRLIDFTIARDFPQLDKHNGEVRAQWFREVCERTATMVAAWMRVGFVHGVMNTDNMSILGLTIDYGPYGWVDNLDPGWTPNTTDEAGRRYCFGRQPGIARWNLERLADALAVVMTDTAPLIEGIAHFDRTYNNAATRDLAAKFGLREWIANDSEWVNAIFGLMHKAEVDMSEFFRALAAVDLDAQSVESLHSAFYREDLWETHRGAFAQWLARYTQRCHHDGSSGDERRARMNAVNPRYVLRNYLAQQAIDAAEAGDASMIGELLEVMRRPYEVQSGRETFAAKRPDWARQKAGCSMLSCSS